MVPLMMRCIRISDELSASAVARGIENVGGEALKEICCENLSFQYEGRTETSLTDVNLKIHPDEFVVITGKSGCGKTALVRVLCCLLKEKTGEVLIDGRILSRKTRSNKAYFVMQDADNQLFTENVADELGFRNDKDPDIDAEIDDTLSLLNLEFYKECHPLSLSGGQKHEKRCHYSEKAFSQR